MNVQNKKPSIEDGTAECEKELDEAIKGARRVMSANNLKEAGE